MRTKMCTIAPSALLGAVLSHFGVTRMVFTQDEML